MNLTGSTWVAPYGASANVTWVDGQPYFACEGEAVLPGQCDTLLGHPRGECLFTPAVSGPMNTSGVKAICVCYPLSFKPNAPFNESCQTANCTGGEGACMGFSQIGSLYVGVAVLDCVLTMAVMGFYIYLLVGLARFVPPVCARMFGTCVLRRGGNGNGGSGEQAAAAAWRIRRSVLRCTEGGGQRKP